MRERHRDLTGIGVNKVPRCFLKADAKYMVLNGFADVSSRAFGAVIYIQTVFNTNEITSQLLCRKSNVAPTKVITMPRHELSTSFFQQN